MLGRSRRRHAGTETYDLSMNDDLTWADDDLARAARLWDRVRYSDEPVDESWEHNDYQWRLIARRDSLPDGRPDAYLKAHGQGGRSTWRFVWRDGAWSPAKHVEFDG